MGYVTEKPDELEPTALALYMDYGCGSNQGKLHYVKCHSRGCHDCHSDPALYRACPTCGAKLDVYARRPYTCECGTVIWVCMAMLSPVITRYITNDMFKAEAEDTI